MIKNKTQQNRSGTALLQKTSLAIGLALLSLSSVAQAGQGPQPGICTRSCWGARAPQCGISQMGSLTRAIIHHTGGAGEYSTNYETSKAKCRSNQSYVMDSLGYCDADYHFYVDGAGNLFEGRSGSMGSLPRGSHDGCNANSFGFAALGYFHPPYNNPFTAACRSSLEAIIAWRMPSSWTATAGNSAYCSVSIGSMEGHYRVNSTACPGDGIIPSIAGMRTGVMNRKNGGGGSVSRRLDVFHRGTDNALAHKSFDQLTYGWSAWENLGGVLTSDPAAVSWGPNNINIYMRGLGNDCVQLAWTGTAWAWSPSGSLGGVLAGAPAASSWGVGRNDIFWRGTDNTLRHKCFDSTLGGWKTEENLGGVLTSDPAAVSRSVNTIDIFMRGASSNLVQLAYTGTSWVWNPGGNLGGVLAGKPTAASWGSGRVDLFWRGTDNTLRHKCFDSSLGGWKAEENLGGVLTSDPGAVSWGPNRIDIFMRGTGGDNVQLAWTGSGWVWSGIGGTPGGAPTVASWSRNQ